MPWELCHSDMNLAEENAARREAYRASKKGGWFRFPGDFGHAVAAGDNDGTEKFGAGDLRLVCRKL